ncbi:MAG: DinB family protein [Candidatus Dormibacteria bacterium]
MAITSAVTPATILLDGLKNAHELLLATTSDVTDEIANRPVTGTANPVGTALAHVVLAEDAVFNGLILGGAPLFATTYEGKTGVSIPSPRPGTPEFSPEAMATWFKTAKITISQLRTYAQAVFAQTESKLANLDDVTLQKPVQVPFSDTPLTAYQVINRVLIGHVNNFTGEISAIKGTFGLKGYPF